MRARSRVMGTRCSTLPLARGRRARVAACRARGAGPQRARVRVPAGAAAGSRRGAGGLCRGSRRRRTWSAARPVRSRGSRPDRAGSPRPAGEPRDSTSRHRGPPRRPLRRLPRRRPWRACAREQPASSRPGRRGHRGRRGFTGMAAAVSPSSMTASTWPLVTTVPLCTRISRTTPFDRRRHLEHDLVGLEVGEVLVASDRIARAACARRRASRRRPTRGAAERGFRCS